MRRTSRLEITAEQLEYLFGYDLTFQAVAETLRVSESTVKRRAQEHSISVRDRRSSMTDHELDEVVRQIQTDFQMQCESTLSLYQGASEFHT